MMKVIYVAGPYRSKSEWGLIKNIREAEDAALEIWRLGAAAICPHKNTAHFGGAHELSNEVWIDGDLEILRRCDAMFLLDGFMDSVGAMTEKKEAERLEIPIFRHLYDLRKWLNDPDTYAED